jgi:hypothetical protein
MSLPATATIGAARRGAGLHRADAPNTGRAAGRRNESWAMAAAHSANAISTPPSLNRHAAVP